MNKLNRLTLHALAALFGCAAPAHAAVIWSEDFSAVSDWTVLADPGGGSSITSNGSEGLFYVNAASSSAAFIPINTGPASLVPFNPANASEYTMDFSVASVTSSTSYDIVFDEFDSGGGYLTTLFGVVAQTAFVGSDSVSLGSFTYNPSTAYIAPKINVYTGDGAQTVAFTSMEFNVVPEPGAHVLGLAGICLLLLRRHAAKPPGSRGITVG